MERYINAERLKSFFRHRNNDLFSVDTICSVIDLFPDGIGGEFLKEARMTRRDSEGAYVSTDFAWENGCAEVRGGAINLLAEYEDTGLSPVEVMEMKMEK